MISFDELIKKAYKNNKKISIEEIEKMDLDDNDFKNLILALQDSGIEIYSNIEMEKTICSDTLSTYLNEISNNPVLAFEEEQELFKKLEKGDESVREKIIK